MEIWKVNEFNFLNELVEELISRWSQNLANTRSPSYLKQEIKYIYMVKYIHICIMFLMHDKLMW